MRISLLRIILFVFFTFVCQFSYAQSGIGVGTESPNPHAILDVVSPSNNKGVLIPRLTTAQRTAMSTSLSVTENGLMVFDSDLNGFYFWSGTTWNAVSVVQDLQLVGNTLTITNNSEATALDLSTIQDGVDDADNDPGNEIQDLQLVGNTLTITNNSTPTDIDLAPFAGTNTDNQDLTFASTFLSISGGTGVDLMGLVDDADANPTNEIQNISTSGAAGNISLTSGSTLTLNINDADASLSNELITGASLLGTTLTITDAGGNTNVNLLGLQDGTGTDNQQLTIATDLLSLEDGGGAIDLSTYRDNTDNQNLGNSSSGTDRTITISGGANTTFNIADNDNSTSNELITGASLLGTTLTITDAGGNTNVNLLGLQDGTGTDNQQLTIATDLLSLEDGGGAIDLSTYRDNTDNQNLGNSSSGTDRTITISGGANTTFNVADNDNSTSNEIQDLNLTGTILKITNNGAATDIDLSPLQDGTGTDNQQLTIATDLLSLEDGGGAIDLSTYRDNTDNQNLGNSSSGTDRTITISGGANTTFNVADNDNSTSNELITGASLLGTTLTITDAGGNTNVNLLGLQDGTGTDNQQLTIATDLLSLEDGGGAIDLSTYRDNTDNQNLSSVLSNGTSAGLQRITSLGAPVSNNDASTKSYVDGKDHSDNQTLSISGSTLSISSGNSVTIPTSTPLAEAFKVYRKAGTGGSMVKGVYFNIYDSEVYNLNGKFNVSTGIYSAPADGIYRFGGVISMVTDNADFLILSILVNETLVYQKTEHGSSAANGALNGYEFATDLVLNGGDEVKIQFEIPGADQTYVAGHLNSYIYGTLITEF